jgi:hypothetical protein
MKKSCLWKPEPDPSLLKGINGACVLSFLRNLGTAIMTTDLSVKGRSGLHGPETEKTSKSSLFRERAFSASGLAPILFAHWVQEFITDMDRYFILQDKLLKTYLVSTTHINRGIHEAVAKFASCSFSQSEMTKGQLEAGLPDVTFFKPKILICVFFWEPWDGKGWHFLWPSGIY